jgi:hypothetical protein
MKKMHTKKESEDVYQYHNEEAHTSILKSTSGRVAVPILLYFLGVPGIVAFLLWLFIFRGA